MQFGKLESVDLRKGWKDESTEFTPWLAQEENIAILSEAIGIELEVQGQEEKVGPFRADILCKDTLYDRYVLIENQLERTDHKHLGQLMTYAAGLNAVTIIWIAAKFADEHRAALDWLNTITDDTVHFFGIEIQLFRIGDSPPAPTFTIVSKPNDWAKEVKQGADRQNVTPTKELQREYWQTLKTMLENTGSPVKMQKPLPQHWTNMAIGKSHFTLQAFANTRDKRIAVGLLLSGDEAVERIKKLKEKYEPEAKTQISPDVEWSLNPDAKEQSIVIRKRNTDPGDKTKWEEQHTWLKKYLEGFYVYFKDKIKEV